MYIEPNTTIRLLKNCPLDNTYDHTIWFADKSSQTSYFRGLTKYVLSEQTYQRVNKGRMRVQYKADDIYDCNYLMFQNSNYGSKWFYAFIKSVEYVNNITSEIEFEIDVMQTWYFDYTLGECFVEREHTGSDKIGEHTVPEKLEVGDYIIGAAEASDVLSDMSIVVAATFNSAYQDAKGSYFGGIFSGLYYTVFPNTADGAKKAQDFINGAGTKIDGVVSVFLMPTAMVTVDGKDPKKRQVSVARTYKLTRVDGSPPKNNKLYTYPYNFLYVTNMQGNGAAYPYEYFYGSSDDTLCYFDLLGDMTPNPSVILVPKYYKGYVENMDEKMVLQGFPQLGFATDTFKAWVAQQSANLAGDGLSTALSVGVSAATGNPLSLVSTATNISEKVISTMAGLPRAVSAPDQAKGGGSPSTLAAFKLLDFRFLNKHIKSEYVSIIDDYFTMFGYARHRVKVPNRHVRKYWTYTKTIGCDIHGSVPADDMNKICSIYNNGITFWTNGDNIGNYSLDNSII